MLQKSKQQVNTKEAKYTQPPSKENNWNQHLKQQQKTQKQQQILNKNEQKQKANTKNMLLLQRSQQQYQYQEQQLQEQQQQLVDQNNNKNNQQQFKQQHQNIVPINNFRQKKTQNNKHEISTSPINKHVSQQQLQSIIHENQQQIKQLKLLISSHRQELKKIGQQVDEDLQKSMVGNKFVGLATMKQKTTVNIKELFSQKINTNQPQRIKKLRQQLIGIRKQSKSLKQLITTKSQQINDPVNKQNYYKHQQLFSRLKLMNLQLVNKRKEAGLVKEEVKRLKVAANIQEVEEMEKKMVEGEEIIGKVVGEIKEEKTKAYRLQKEDVWLMEKYKFLAQKKSQIDHIINNNNTINTTTKPTYQHLTHQVTSIISQINSILQQRNKTQSQRSRLLKQLNTQIQQYESKNLIAVSELRSIDAFLLQYYSQQRHGVGSISSSVGNNSGVVNNNNNSNMTRSNVSKSNTGQQKMGESLITTPLKQQKQNKNSLQQQQRQLLLSSQSPLISSTLTKSKQINDKNVVIVSVSVEIGGNNVGNQNNNTAKSKFRTKVTTSGNNNYNNTNKPPVTQKTQSIVNTQQSQPLLQQSQQHQTQQQKLSFIFGDMKPDQKGAILSDQILGQVKIKQLTLLVDDQNCYGLYCKYVTKQGKQVNGMKIHQKNVQGLVDKVCLIIKDGMYVDKIKVGYGGGMKNQIKLVEVLTAATTMNKNMNYNDTHQEVGSSQLKWKAKSYQQQQSHNNNNKNNNNNSNNNIKPLIDELIIKQQYSSLSIKAKLISTEQVHSTISKSLNQLGKIKPKLKLAGFAVNYTLMKKK